jgi:hypothetical protein
LLAVSANFIYKKLRAPTKTEARYASFYAFVKIFLGAIVFKRSGARRPSIVNGSAERRLVDTIRIFAICDYLTQVVGFDNL